MATIGEKLDKILIIVSGLEPMVKDHHNILNGNGKDGLVADFAVVKDRQDQCPSRKANTIEGKKVNIMTITMICMILTFIVDIVFRLAGKF